MHDLDSLESALEKYFGHKHFRPKQDDLIAAVLEGRDVLGIMPTGGGKSLCYQLPALMLPGTAVIVSPLIALMKDQVDALTEKNIPAAAINSTQSKTEQLKVLNRLTSGELKLIYVAPERFRYDGFLRQLAEVQVSFFAIDEAHCVSQWGHDFRPDYLGLGRAINRIGRRPIAAFTATATPEVRSDILSYLELKDPYVEVTGFARPNLTFRVTSVNKMVEKDKRMSQLLKEGRASIIYCATRKRVERVSELLNEWGIDHASYHGGMDERSREFEQNRFMGREVDTVVATNAFGMGIDRSDIRLVLHYEIPGSVEAYYQEAGRAGRDGLPSHCELLFNYGDRRTQEFFIEGSNPELTFIEGCYEYLCHESSTDNSIEKSIQEIADGMGCRNSMQIASSLKVLSSAGAIERFNIEGQRIRGTRLKDQKKKFRDWPVDTDALEEKKRRDWLRLERLIQYAQTDDCRQSWMQAFFGETAVSECEICDNCLKSDGTAARALNESETITLQKFLSGVARMSDKRPGGEWEPRFGRGLILQMLTGSSDRKVKQFNLDKLTTYGLLKNEGAAFVRELTDECLKRGYTVSTGGLRPLLTLSTSGEQVMRGIQKAIMKWPELIVRTKSSHRGQALKLKAESDSGDGDLLDLLKRKRLQLARIRGNVPPYKIFSNRVLEQLAEQQPESPEQAMLINGIGEVKARRVLSPFLKVIADYQKRGS